jgi:hypothetical protein
MHDSAQGHVRRGIWKSCFASVVSRVALTGWRIPWVFARFRFDSMSRSGHFLLTALSGPGSSGERGQRPMQGLEDIPPPPAPTVPRVSRRARRSAGGSAASSLPGDQDGQGHEVELVNLSSLLASRIRFRRCRQSSAACSTQDRFLN